MSARVCGCGAPVPNRQQSCIGCAWEQGFEDARVVTRADEVFGAYAGTIRERVASCSDYLGRISRTLDAAPSAHYLAEKAELLRDAANQLAGSCHDMDGWLAKCGEHFTSEMDGQVFIEECVLQAVHGGDHRAEVPPTPLAQARRSADEFAQSALAVADRLGWLAHWGSCGLPPADELSASFDPMLRDLRRGLERLGTTVAALIAARRREKGDKELLGQQSDFEAEGLEHLAVPRRE